MAYEFKRLSDVTAVEAVTEDTNVLIEEDGIVKKVNKSYVGEKVSDATLVEAATEDANVIIEENGAVKRVHKSQIGLTEVSWDDLKDRPFYEEKPVLTELMPVTTVHCSEENAGWDEYTSVPKLNLGATYIVAWDGVEYQCVAADDGYGGVALGNFGSLDAGSDTGEPFFIYEEYDMGGDYHGIYAAEPGEHTCSIVSLVQNIKTIDYKWMPKGYPSSKTEMVAIVPERSITGVDEGGGYRYSEETNLNFEHGVTYECIFNGKKYVCVCDDGYLGLEGDIYFVTYFNGIYNCFELYWREEFGETVTISVITEQEDVITISPKFMAIYDVKITMKENEYNEEEYFSDKSYHQIIEAYQAGYIINVYIDYGNRFHVMCPMTEVADFYVAFTHTSDMMFEHSMYRFILYDDAENNMLNYKKYKLAIEEE